LTALKSGGASDAHAFLDQLPGAHVEFYSYKKSNHSKNQLSGKQEFKTYINNLNFASSRRRP
ncbi:MAG TPA: hypothetical protein VNK26_08660, partial [Pyrinomonadaceae bacterium]|nr:hypothetical protein [Pyrinomonadaceae bacterium]